MVFYRIACRQPQTPTCRWISTRLRRWEDVVNFLHYYFPLPLSRVHIFMAADHEQFTALLTQQNSGTKCCSITADQFLQEKGLYESLTPERKEW